MPPKQSPIQNRSAKHRSTPQKFDGLGPTFGLPSLIAQVGDLWVLSKPSGFAMHETGDDMLDLRTWAIRHLGAPRKLSPVHRIDRETSGVVLCAGNAETSAHYGQMFSRGQVGKRYRALVHGRAHGKGVIRRALRDRGTNQMQEAVTRYRKLAWYGPTTYLEARPETGRRHQIRRHLQGIGHSVVGDKRYPPKCFRRIARFPGRLWLHAYRIELPGGVQFEAPLPDELKNHLATLAELG